MCDLSPKSEAGAWWVLSINCLLVVWAGDLRRDTSVNSDWRAGQQHWHNNSNTELNNNTNTELDNHTNTELDNNTNTGLDNNTNNELDNNTNTELGNNTNTKQIYMEMLS